MGRLYIFRRLSEALWYLQCDINGYDARLHWTVNIMFYRRHWAIAPRAVEIWLNFDLALDCIDIWGHMTGVSGFTVYKSQWKIAMMHCLKREL